MSVIAVYGGGFNPPHVGHAMVMSWVLQTGLADRVLMVPSHDHPFGKNMAPFARRVEWCEALISDMGMRHCIHVSTLEQEMPAPNYSINLLRKLREISPPNTFRFVMGADNLHAAARWFGFDDIVREFPPIYANRGDLEPFIPTSPIFPNISSTEIRNKLQAGEPVNHLLTRTVVKMVDKDMF